MHWWVGKIEDCTPERCYNMYGKGPDEDCKDLLGGKNINMVYIKTNSKNNFNWANTYCYTKDTANKTKILHKVATVSSI